MRIFRRLGLTIALVGLVASSPARASDSQNASSIDVSAGVDGSRVMAGIRWGSPPGSGSGDDDCEWSVALPRDTHSDPGEVTMVVGSTTYRLYDYTCLDRDPATTYHWIPEVSTATLAEQASSVVYENIPAPWGNFAPPAHRGIVTLGTWIWVSPLMWIPIRATAWVPTPSGPVAVTTTATPKELTFDPGDGELGTGEVTCRGPGIPWVEAFGDSLPSPCMYTYLHSSSTQDDGTFDATVSITWDVTWVSSIGARGSLGSVTLDAHHAMVVREIQGLVTNPGRARN